MHFTNYFLTLNTKYSFFLNFVCNATTHCLVFISLAESFGPSIKEWSTAWYKQKKVVTQKNKQSSWERLFTHLHRPWVNTECFHSRCWEYNTQALPLHAWMVTS